MRRQRQKSPVEKRRRGACWKCQERHLKCTLERPVCSNCARSNHACQYGIRLVWREDAIARGVCFGRQGVSGSALRVPVSSRPISSSNRFRGKIHFLHTTSCNFSDSQNEDSAHRRPSSLIQDRHGKDGRGEKVEEQRARRPDTENGMPLAGAFDTPNFGSINTLSPGLHGKTAAEAHLFDFFVSYMCPNLSHSTLDNPYWEFIVPLSLTSVPLFYALLSWAANGASFATSTGREMYNVTSAEFKARALRELRQEIASAHGDWLSAPDKWSSILATIIILSCNDITEVCSEAWITHLRAARILCGMAWPSVSTNTSDKFRRFCVMWFVSHDIMSRTAWSQELLFDPAEWFARDDENAIDPMIVCSRGLIRQVSAIGTLMTDIQRAKQQLPLTDNNFVDGDDASFKTRRDAIEKALRSLSQVISPSCHDCKSSTELLQVAESKRLCALIYFYACIDSATPSHPAIQSLTSKVMRILTELQPKPSLTFTLFVVGTLGVRNEDDRRIVMDKFDELMESRWLASIARARDVVVSVWLDRDLGKCGKWENLVETKSRLLSLA